MGASVYWDFCVDWGVFEKGSPNRFLRAELFYPKKVRGVATGGRFIYLRWAPGLLRGHGV